MLNVSLRNNYYVLKFFDFPASPACQEVKPGSFKSAIHEWKEKHGICNFLRARVHKSRTLSGKLENFEIAQALAMSSLYRTQHRYVIYLSNGSLF